MPLQHLDGMDSLLSIVQMPAGVPVATVSIGGARNAGLLAVRILASGADDYAVPAPAMERFQERCARWLSPRDDGSAEVASPDPRDSRTVSPVSSRSTSVPPPSFTWTEAPHSGRHSWRSLG